MNGYGTGYYGIERSDEEHEALKNAPPSESLLYDWSMQAEAYNDEMCDE